MTTYLEMCSNRVAALQEALFDEKVARDWLTWSENAPKLLWTLLDAHKAKQERALKEALEFEEFARSQEDEP